MPMFLMSIVCHCHLHPAFAKNVNLRACQFLILCGIVVIFCHLMSILSLICHLCQITVINANMYSMSGSLSFVYNTVTNGKVFCHTWFRVIVIDAMIYATFYVW